MVLVGGAKRRFRGRKGLTKVQRKTVRKIAKSTVKNLAEKNYIVNYISQNAAYDNNSVLLNDPSQGVGDTQRDGDQYRLTSIEIRGIVKQAPNEIPSRLIVFLLKPGGQNLTSNTAVVPNAAELFQQGVANTAVYDMFRNDLKNRFQILYDRTFASFNTQVGSGSTGYMSFRKMINLKNKVVQFDAASQRITKNALFYIWVSGDTIVGGTGMNLDATMKIRYIDL